MDIKKESSLEKERLAFIECVELLTQCYDEIYNTGKIIAVKRCLVDNIRYDKLPNELSPFFDQLIDFCNIQRGVQDGCDEVDFSAEQERNNLLIDGALGVASKAIQEDYIEALQKANEIYHGARRIEHQKNSALKKLKYDLSDKIYSAQVGLKKTIDLCESKYGYKRDSLLTFPALQRLNESIKEYLEVPFSAKRLLLQFPTSFLAKGIYIECIKKSWGSLLDEDRACYIEEINKISTPPVIVRYCPNRQQIASRMLAGLAHSCYASFDERIFEMYCRAVRVSSELFPEDSPDYRFHRGFANLISYTGERPILSQDSFVKVRRHHLALRVSHAGSRELQRQ